MFTSFDEMQSLVSRGLATVKTNKDNSLHLFKYHRKVMYNYLWKKIDGLMECRGHVYSSDGKIVQAPVRKSFGYLEDGWWATKSLDTEVRIFKKYNGFMAAATEHNGQLLVTTTGSFDSNYQKKAEQMIRSQFPNCVYSPYYTDLYEIIWSDDPHIVDEGTERAIYLGSRCTVTGEFIPADAIYTPGQVVKLRDAIDMAMYDVGEGFMLYDVDDVKCMYACKLKTPYYVGKKALMRMNKASVANMYCNRRVSNLPQMWIPLVDKIIRDHQMSTWIDMSDQERRAYIENL